MGFKLGSNMMRSRFWKEHSVLNLKVRLVEFLGDQSGSFCKTQVKYNPDLN